MPVVLAREEDGLAPLDAHHRAISIAHCAANVGVEVGESRAHCCHVVRRPSVEEPTGAPPPPTVVAELHKQLVLLEVDRGGGHRRRRYWCR
jgi:hypothetical protein